MAEDKEITETTEREDLLQRSLHLQPNLFLNIDNAQHVPGNTEVHQETQNGEYNYNNGSTPGQNIPLPNSSGYISDTVSSTDAHKLCVSTFRLTSNNMTSIYQPLNDAILLPSGAHFLDYNKTANGLPVCQPVDNPTHQLCVSAQTFF